MTRRMTRRIKDQKKDQKKKRKRKHIQDEKLEEQLNEHCAEEGGCFSRSSTTTHSPTTGQFPPQCSSPDGLQHPLHPSSPIRRQCQHHSQSCSLV